MTPEQQAALLAAEPALHRRAARDLGRGLVRCVDPASPTRSTRVKVVGFPLGFWFATQGSILTFVVLVFVYVKLMNDLDRKYGVYER